MDSRGWWMRAIALGYVWGGAAAACHGEALGDGPRRAPSADAEFDPTVIALRDRSASGFLAATPGYAWNFPSDHWFHPGYKTEWWYFTGHLQDLETGSDRFAYQFTFFRVGLPPGALQLDSTWSTDAFVMVHVALSDLEVKDHRFSEVLYRVNPTLGGFGEEPDPLIAWSKAASGTPGRWTLRWTGHGFALEAYDARQGFGFSLRTEEKKTLIFQGPEGLSRKGDDENQASLYYSFTRLKTEGSVSVDGKRYAVVGESWMDKEFGSSMLSTEQVGWDWFSLQFDDGRELMIYVLRNPTGGLDHASGTLVAADGGLRYLDASDWILDAKRWWSSSEGRAYPVEWTLDIDDSRFHIEAVFDDQENRGEVVPGLRYWEGAVDVTDSGSGEHRGRGFLEMTGYAER